MWDIAGKPMLVRTSLGSNPAKISFCAIATRLSIAFRSAAFMLTLAKGTLTVSALGSRTGCISSSLRTSLIVKKPDCNPVL